MAGAVVAVDPLAEWYVHPIVIARWSGSGAIESWSDPSPAVLGFVHDGTKLVVGPGGKEITSSAQIALPIGTPYVPVNSKVTLPAQFGGRTSKVITTSVGDGGGQPTPDHIEIALL